MKKIAIAFGALILAFVLFHAGLWIFKTRTLQNHLQEIVIKQNTHISVGSMSSSILPFSHKVTIQNVVVKDKDLEASTQIIEIYPTAFSMSYVVKFPQEILVKSYAKGPDVLDNKIELSPDSKFTISESKKANNFLLKYNGSGYKFIDKKTQKMLFEVQMQEGQTEIDFGDDFTYHSKSISSKMMGENNEIWFSKGPSDIEFGMAKQGEVVSARFNINVKDVEFFGIKKPQQDATTQSVPTQAPQDQTMPQIGENFSIKSVPYDDFNSGKIGLVLVGSMSLQQNPNAVPAQQQQLSPYPRKPNFSNFSIQVENFEFSHQQYKIFLNGKLDATPQTYPFALGAVTLQIENLDNIVNSIILDRAEKHYAKLEQPEEKMKQFRENLNSYIGLIKNLAARNAKTTPTRLVFDIKKDPGDPEMVINHTSFTELLFQILMMEQAKKMANEQQYGGAMPQGMIAPMQNPNSYAAPQYTPPSLNQIRNQMMMQPQPRP